MKLDYDTYHKSLIPAVPPKNIGVFFTSLCGTALSAIVSMQLRTTFPAPSGLFLKLEIPTSTIEREKCKQLNSPSI